MKTFLSLIICSMAVTSLVSSCGRTAPVQTESAPMSESAPVKSENPDKTEVPVKSETPDKEETKNFIGEEKAKEIALKKAGLSHGEVVFEHVGYDKDDGVWYYDVEFKKEKTKYDAKINAEDGTVAEWEVDTDD